MASTGNTSGGNASPASASLQDARREASGTLPPPPGNPRFALIDPLRAIAAIGVMLVHVGILSGGFEAWYKQPLAHLDIGVPVFFLLSGFLLYRPYVASRQNGLPPVRTSSYARNRFFRIFPAYWAVLIVTAIVPGMYGLFTDNWWVYVGLLDNFPVYVREGDCATNLFRCGVPPAWSLGVELSFYLLLPFFAWFTARLTSLFRPRQWLSVELAVLAAISIFSVAIQSSVFNGDLQQTLFFSALGRGWWFALGMGLAVVSVWVTVRGAAPSGIKWVSRRSGLLWALAGGLYLFVALVVLEPGPSLAAPVIPMNEYLTQYLTFGLVALLLMLPAVFGENLGGIPRRVLRAPALVWLGLISYGIFLWHYAVMIALLDLGILDVFPRFDFPVLAISTFSVTLVFATASYYLLERPLIRWARRRGRRGTGPREIRQTV